MTYHGERTRLEIGDRNIIREYVTISRGTAKGTGVTRIGSDTLIMAYTHVGHDSVIGDHSMLINGATLAGHVTVEEWAVVGALCPVHQFVRIGAHSYVGGGTTITQDVLPYSMTSAERDTHAFMLNKVGLQRRGFSHRTHREAAPRVQNPAGIEAEHLAGAGEATALRASRERTSSCWCGLSRHHNEE